MESKTKVLGHPIHPMLIVFPLGLFISVVVFDIIYLISGNTVFPMISFYNIAFGVVGGLLAALFGFIDWLSLPGGTRAKSVGVFHGLGNALIVVLFVLSWLIRNPASGHIPSTLALVLSFAAILLGLITAWLGGELVDRLGVGVYPGANLNAPNSLSGAAASVTRSPVPVTGEQREHGSERPEDRDEMNPPGKTM